ncbi:MAG: hypothetical protein Q9209_000422 [Squamulea sp. 1 TL-2023]
MGLSEIRTALKVDLKKPAADQPGLHNRWHPDIPFNGTIKNGEVVKIECVDWTGGQIGNNDSADDVKNIDLTKVHYLSGPFEVETAEPGDVLIVEIQDVQPFPHQPWGFSGVFTKDNGGGFLDDIYPNAAKAIWDFEGLFCSSRHIPRIRFPGLVHPGILGCAPSSEVLNEWNRREGELISSTTLERIVAQPPQPQNVHAGSATDDVKAKVGKEGARTIPGRPEHGGNCDIKNLSRGSKTFLPILVKGAKFSVGDLHFSQGDGEISFCGAIEMAGVITVKLTVMKNGMADLGMKSPIFQPGPVEPHYGPGRYLTFEGFSVDENGKQHYMDATVAYRQTTLRCIEYLKRFGYNDYQVYLLLSCAPVQGHIAGLVDIPNACTTLGLPMDIFDFDISPTAAAQKTDMGTCAFASSNTSDLPYKLDKSSIKTDLSSDRPLYILSAYGPGRDAPQQLFGGQPREQSFEELRLRHYELASAGNETQAIQEAAELYNNAEQQIKSALDDLDGAIRYITEAANQHPNRLDICQAKGSDVSQPQQPPTGPRSVSGAFNRGSAFGQPLFGQSAVSVSSPTFGPPSFGQPSVPAPATAFGKPSFGQAAAPASSFGQPTILGQPSTTSGQPSTLATAPAFGQSATPLPFGQSQLAAKPFGLQQLQQQPPAFGQSSSPFGQPSFTGPQTSGAFGQQPSTATLNPFTTAPKPTSGIGQSTASANPFGQAAAPQPSGIFGQPSTSSATANLTGSKDSDSTSGAFGQSAATTTAPASGQPAAPTMTGIFRRPSAAPPSTGFAPSSTPAVNAGPFGLAPTSITPGSGAPPNPTYGPGKPGERKLLTWQGHQVQYVDDEPCVKNDSDGGWQKIWFPEGPPKFTSKTQEYPDGYVLDEAARENFRQFLQHGVGSDGLIPGMPPPRDMISWNF